MTNHWLDRDREAFREFVRRCLEIFYIRRRTMNYPGYMTLVSPRRLVNAVEAYAKGEKIGFKKEYDDEYKIKVVQEEWYRISHEIIV